MSARNRWRLKNQTACKPGSVRFPPLLASLGRATVIPLDRPLLDGSRDLPGRLGPASPAASPKAPARRPYSVLLQAGLAMPSPSPGPRWALTPPFHPSLSRPRPIKAVCFLWRYPWGRPRRALPAAFSPWSPDFPRARKRTRDRPAVWFASRVGLRGGEVKAGALLAQLRVDDLIPEGILPEPVFPQHPFAFKAVALEKGAGP